MFGKCGITKFGNEGMVRYNVKRIIVKLIIKYGRVVGRNFSDLFSRNILNRVTLIAAYFVWRKATTVYETENLQRLIRPFVFAGHNANTNIRQKYFNVIKVRLMVLSPAIENVVCDTFDRELISQLKRLGVDVEEYPLFHDEFDTQLRLMQSLLMPNMYMVFGYDLREYNAIYTMCEGRNIPMITGYH